MTTTTGWSGVSLPGKRTAAQLADELARVARGNAPEAKRNVQLSLKFINSPVLSFTKVLEVFYLL